MATLAVFGVAAAALDVGGGGWQTGVNISSLWLWEDAPGRFRGRTPCDALGAGIVGTVGMTQSARFIPEACAWDTPVLWSFPGSGNTWVRHMLEQATGLATGSVYNDESLRKIFRGEMHCAHDTLVNKAHAVHTPYEVLRGANASAAGLPWHGARSASTLAPRAVRNTYAHFARKCAKWRVRRAAIIDREPFGAIWSEYQRHFSAGDDGGHVAVVTPAAFSRAHFDAAAVRAAADYVAAWESHLAFARAASAAGAERRGAVLGSAGRAGAGGGGGGGGGPEPAAPAAAPSTAAVVLVPFADLVSRCEPTLARLLRWLAPPVPRPRLPEEAAPAAEPARASGGAAERLLLSRASAHAVGTDPAGDGADAARDDDGWRVRGACASRDRKIKRDGAVAMPASAAWAEATVCRVWAVLGHVASALGHAPREGARCAHRYELAEQLAARAAAHSPDGRTVVLTFASNSRGELDVLLNWVLSALMAPAPQRPGAAGGADGGSAAAAQQARAARRGGGVQGESEPAPTHLGAALLRPLLIGALDWEAHDALAALGAPVLPLAPTFPTGELRAHEGARRLDGVRLERLRLTRHLLGRGYAVLLTEPGLTWERPDLLSRTLELARAHRLDALLLGRGSAVASGAEEEDAGEGGGGGRPLGRASSSARRDAAPPISHGLALYNPTPAARALLASAEARALQCGSDEQAVAELLSWEGLGASARRGGARAVPSHRAAADAPAWLDVRTVQLPTAAADDDRLSVGIAEPDTSALVYTAAAEAADGALRATAPREAHAPHGAAAAVHTARGGAAEAVASATRGALRAAGRWRLPSRWRQLLANAHARAHAGPTGAPPRGAAARAGVPGESPPPAPDPLEAPPRPAPGVPSARRAAGFEHTLGALARAAAAVDLSVVVSAGWLLGPAAAQAASAGQGEHPTVPGAPVPPSPADTSAALRRLAMDLGAGARAHRLRLELIVGVWRPLPRAPAGPTPAEASEGDQDATQEGVSAAALARAAAAASHGGDLAVRVVHVSASSRTVLLRRAPAALWLDSAALNAGIRLAAAEHVLCLGLNARLLPAAFDAIARALPPLPPAAVGEAAGGGAERAHIVGACALRSVRTVAELSALPLPLGGGGGTAAAAAREGSAAPADNNTAAPAPRELAEGLARCARARAEPTGAVGVLLPARAWHAARGVPEAVALAPHADLLLGHRLAAQGVGVSWLGCEPGPAACALAAGRQFARWWRIGPAANGKLDEAHASDTARAEPFISPMHFASDLAVLRAARASAGAELSCAWGLVGHAVDVDASAGAARRLGLDGAAAGAEDPALARVGAGGRGRDVSGGGGGGTRAHVRVPELTHSADDAARGGAGGDQCWSAARQRAAWREWSADASHASPLLVVQVEGGLGNRLRAFASGWALADRLGSRLVVIWPVNIECAARYDDLFSRNASVLVLDRRPPAWPARDFAEYDGIAAGARVRLSAAHSRQRSVFVRTQDFVTSATRRYSLQEYAERMAWLAPRPELAALAEHFERAARLPAVIGAHVRMQGDEGRHVFGLTGAGAADMRAVHGAAELKNFNLGDASASAGLRARRAACGWATAFAPALRSLARAQPSRRFLVACDADGCVDGLRDAVGRADSVLALRDMFAPGLARACASDSRSALCQRLALLELQLLSRTEHLLISQPSSFSDAARFLAYGRWLTTRRVSRGLPRLTGPFGVRSTIMCGRPANFKAIMLMEGQPLRQTNLSIAQLVERVRGAARSAAMRPRVRLPARG